MTLPEFTSPQGRKRFTLAVLTTVPLMFVIKADPALKHIPIIVVTSYALSGDEAKGRAAGCDAYVGKPYSPRALLAKIREYAA